VLRLGELRFRTGEWDEAERCYTIAAGQIPDDPDVLDHLAELRAARGEFDEALKLSERALAAAPRPEFHQNRGDVLLAAGKPDEALASHEQALAAYLEASNAGYANYFHHVAGLLCDVETLRDPAEAQRWARRDFQIRRTVATMDALAWAYFKNGQLPDAERAAAQALRTGTRNARIRCHADVISRRESASTHRCLEWRP
jgi:tetratricopeptide (TPR) repeat protein